MSGHETTGRWRPIDEAPEDFGRRDGPMPTLLVRDRDRRNWIARRATVNDSGWLQDRTNREVWPVEWMDAG